MKICTAKERLLSFEQARELLRYDPELGLLFWRVDRKRRKAGDIAGSIAPTSGYRVITVNGRNYLQHRVAWLLSFGVWPAAGLDHRNLDKTDNRLCNLREADAVQNGANRRSSVRQTGLAGLKGASFDRRRNAWRASIKINGKTKNLGNHPTEMGAHLAYCREAEQAFGQFYRSA